MTDKEQKKEIKKINYPDFDLEGYISMYTGHTKIARLLFIGERVEGFFERAYKLVLTELKSTTNTKLYKEICKKVGESLGPEYKQDDDWILKTDKKISMDAEFLDTKLNNAKQSLDSKEIRVYKMSLFFYNITKKKFYIYNFFFFYTFYNCIFFFLVRKENISCINSYFFTQSNLFLFSIKIYSFSKNMKIGFPQ